MEIPTELEHAVSQADYLEELLQNHVVVNLNDLSEGQVAALQGLWRGRAKAAKEAEETRARMNQG